jgi:glycosyltransferase involved in cell wall biosynthesis
MTFFSIIIPTYNSEKTLHKCLESVVNQSFKDFEILIIDGVSTDHTLEIAKSFNDNRIKISLEKDEGIYDAMNKGVRLAQGKWLYFLGSDDVLYDSDVLSDIVIFIEKNIQVDFVYGDVIFKKNQNVYAGEFDRVKLCFQNICHQAIFYKKNLFKILGLYNLKYKIWADWDFNMRCFLHPDINIKYIDRIIAIFNDEDGISAIEKIDNLLEKERIDYYLEREIIEKERILKSKAYRLGKFLLKPYSFLKNIIR